MNILRLLLLLATAWLAYQLLLRPLVAARRTRQAPPRQAPPRQVQAVRCAHCGVHVPVQDTVNEGGHTYCSLEHSRLGPR